MSSTQNRKKATNQSEKPMPMYLQKDYPYQGTKVITDIGSIEERGSLYEMQCEQRRHEYPSAGKAIKGYI